MAGSPSSTSVNERPGTSHSGGSGSAAVAQSAEGDGLADREPSVGSDDEQAVAAVMAHRTSAAEAATVRKRMSIPPDGHRPFPEGPSPAAQFRLKGRPDHVRPAPTESLLSESNRRPTHYKLSDQLPQRSMSVRAAESLLVSEPLQTQPDVTGSLRTSAQLRPTLRPRAMPQGRTRRRATSAPTFRREPP